MTMTDSHFLNKQTEFKRILELKSAALADTEDERRVFHRANQQRLQACKDFQFSDEQFSQIARDVASSTPNQDLDALKVEDQLHVQQIVHRFSTARASLSAALAMSLQSHGIRANSLMPDHVISPTPEGYVSGLDIVNSMLESFEGKSTTHIAARQVPALLTP